jgi:pimeloyl-ACP methyl ester carboxylesterase
VPLDAAHLLAATLPDAELQVLPGCGHVPTLTQPAMVADAISEFFQRRR